MMVKNIARHFKDNDVLQFSSKLILIETFNNYSILRATPKRILTHYSCDTVIAPITVLIEHQSLCSLKGNIQCTYCYQIYKIYQFFNVKES